MIVYCKIIRNPEKKTPRAIRTQQGLCKVNIQKIEFYILAINNQKNKNYNFISNNIQKYELFTHKCTKLYSIIVH